MAELPQNVIDARNAAQSVGSSLGEFNSKGYTIEDDLKRTVQEALDYNKDVVGLRSKALGDYLSAPANANVQYGVQQFSTGDKAGQVNPDFVWNPFERNKLIQGSINNAMIPFSLWNTILGMREGQVGQLVDAGTRAFKASQAAAQSKYEQARQYYSDVLGEFTTLQDISAREQQLAMDQQKIDMAKAEAAAKAKAAGSAGINPFQLTGGTTSAITGYNPGNEVVSPEGAAYIDFNGGNKGDQYVEDPRSPSDVIAAVPAWAVQPDPNTQPTPSFNWDDFKGVKVNFGQRDPNSLYIAGQ